ncbi:glucose-6-phosphate isomerase [Caballeronia sp. LZ065]|uniref:O-antigen ligase family protein n=1 Tax=Caballeronia sp. LZ065 TaxID=3038571 RepID=UPI00285A2342|nr:glucose-6-phosphate isomerase [Caballeronia sp. LZ065]MDR5782821.1 glucose-6-phosphate isomerase [Caballeronia sp. LZ065]
MNAAPLPHAPRDLAGRTKTARRTRKGPPEWTAQAVVWGLTALLVLARQGTVLTLAFPLLATSAALYLYFRSPARYVGFMWWVWFLSPEIRRLADWGRGAFTPTSLIQIAPLVVTMICGLTLLRQYKVLAQRRGLPMLLMLLGIAYAYLIGVASSGPMAATYDLANWLYPVLIGFHIMVNAHDYPKYRKVLLDTFVYGLLLMGAYGIVQFFVMPAWDAMWMIGSQMASQGEPVPLGVRVFSTMNSSGPFALVVMAGLTFVMAGTQRARWLAGALGFVSFALSMVRSAWGGWIIAMLLQLLKASNRVRLRIVLGAVVLVGLSVPLLTVGPVADKLGTRLQTMTNLSNDSSYAARNEFYTNFMVTAFTDVTGEGFGATGTSTKLASANGDLGKYGSFDSGVMNVPFVLGWPGGLLYMAGVVLLLVRAWRASFSLRDDKFAQAALSLAFSMIGILLFANTFVSTGGSLLFTSLFAIIAARHHAKLVRRREALFFQHQRLANENRDRHPRSAA